MTTRNAIQPLLPHSAGRPRPRRAQLRRAVLKRDVEAGLRTDPDLAPDAVRRRARRVHPEVVAAVAREPARELSRRSHRGARPHAPKRAQEASRRRGVGRERQVERRVDLHAPCGKRPAIRTSRRQRRMAVTLPHQVCRQLDRRPVAAERHPHHDRALPLQPEGRAQRLLRLPLQLHEVRAPARASIRTRYSPRTSGHRVRNKPVQPAKSAAGRRRGPPSPTCGSRCTR